MGYYLFYLMNSFGRFFRVATWGESHGQAIGVVIDGCPSGMELAEPDIQRELDLRKPGQGDLTSPRREQDKVEILSGIFQGKTTGAPISLLIKNRNVRSEDYEKLKNLFRPGHADFTYQAKYGHYDYRGGGRASGRETAARVAAGAVASKLLSRHGICVLAFARRIGKAALDAALDPALPGGSLPHKSLSFQEARSFREKIYGAQTRCPHPETAAAMEKEIRAAAAQGDSVGGIVELRAYGVPPGLGDPVFGKLDALIALAVCSVGAVKGLEFGAGFGFAALKGSEANDPFEVDTESSEIHPASNKAGGILGGISTGLPIIVRAVIKPTPSISKPQKSVTRDGEPVSVSIGGRHDPCIVIRAVPVLEHMVNLVLADCLLSQHTVPL